MLNKGIFHNYLVEKNKSLAEKGVALEFEDAADSGGIKARATVASVAANEFTKPIHRCIVRCLDLSPYW